MTIQLTEHQAKYINPIALKWIEALKSGEYKQGQGKLGDEDNGFCCLGLLCHVNNWSYLPRSGLLCGVKEYEISGLRSHSGWPKDTDLFKSLTDLNDEKDYTFPMIANHLLRYPEQYFHEIKEEK